jgi:hypothetical protein
MCRERYADREGRVERFREGSVESFGEGSLKSFREGSVESFREGSVESTPAWISRALRLIFYSGSSIIRRH